MSRLVVVLGYSTGRGARIHPICRSRLDHAATIATDRDHVLLSGWARHPSGRSEAALMREAWQGVAAEVLVDEGASTTTQNARHALRLATQLGVDHVVIVTSAWHMRRALAAFRWQSRTRAIRLHAAPAPGRSRWRAVQEMLLLPVTAAQVWSTRCRER